MAFPVPIPAPRRTGFTLMELMVSMGVGVLLIVFLFQLFNATFSAWRSGEDQSDTYREARSAMQLMVRDIGQTAAFPTNPYASPWPSPSPTPGVGAVPVLVLDHHTKPDPQQLPDNGQINEELYCLTNSPNTGVSNLCAVGYFWMWMPDLVPTGDPQYAQKYAAAPHAYALVRQFLGSGRPTTSTTTGAPGLFDCFQAVKGKPLLDFTDVYSRARPPTIPDPALSPPVATGTQLASYIWDLQFRTPDTLLTVGATNSPLNLAQPVQQDAARNTGYANTLPAYIEIRFKALSARAGRKLEGNASVQPQTWNDSNAGSSAYQQLITPGTRQFVARVPLGNASSVPIQ